MQSALARGLIMALSLVLMSGPAVAHHGDAGRYEDTLTSVSGMVLEIQLLNPHSIPPTRDHRTQRPHRPVDGRAGSSEQLERLVLERGCHQGGRSSHHGRPKSQKRPTVHEPL